MKYRSRTEITAMILDTANKETTKTKIMYNAYLSYNQLKEYISILIENNLLEYIEGARTFRTTEKGLNFLKMYREMTKLLQTTTIIKND
jgi:predicted transcriptional regulator